LEQKLKAPFSPGSFAEIGASRAEMAGWHRNGVFDCRYCAKKRMNCNRRLTLAQHYDLRTKAALDQDQCGSLL
jgi:hypothetical protein